MIRLSGNGSEPPESFRAPENRATLEAYLREQLAGVWYDAPYPPSALVDDLFRDFRVPDTYAYAAPVARGPDPYNQLEFLTRPGMELARDAVNQLFRTEVVDPFVAFWLQRCRAAGQRESDGIPIYGSNTLRQFSSAPGEVDRPLGTVRRIGGIALPLREASSGTATMRDRAKAAVAAYGDPETTWETGPV
jgi:hypothetical protein